MATLKCQSGRPQYLLAPPKKIVKQKIIHVQLNDTSEVKSLKYAAEEITPFIGQHDVELVEEDVSSIERKLENAQEKADKRLDGYDNEIRCYESVWDEMQVGQKWIHQTQLEVEEQPTVGSSVEQAQDMLHQHSVLVQQIEGKKGWLDSMQRQGEGLLRVLSLRERELMEKTMRELQISHRILVNVAAEKKQLMTKGISDRAGFQAHLDHVLSWIEEKEHLVSSVPKIPLASSDVNKQIDIYKNLLSDVKVMTPKVDKVLAEGESLLDKSDEIEQQQLQDTLSDLNDKFSRLRSLSQQIYDKSQFAVVSRKNLEDDLLKVSLWTQEAEKTCSTELQLDIPVDKMDDQLKKHQSLNSSCRMQESLLANLIQTADGMTSELSQTDQAALKDKICSLKEGVDRTSAQIQARLKTLQEAMSNKGRFEGELQELRTLMITSKEEVKQLNKGIGHTREDAQNMLERVQQLQDNLVDSKPMLTQLEQTMEQLRTLGQPSACEEITRLNSQHEELQLQANQLQQKLQQAVVLRDQYYTAKYELETSLRVCEEQMEAVEGQGVSVPTRLDRYKNALDTLQSKETQLVLLEDKGQQICIEGTAEDAGEIQDQMDAVRSKMNMLRMQAESKAADLQNVITERKDFDEKLSECLEQLKQKEAVLATQPLLRMDVNSVEQEQKKIHSHKQETYKQLQQMMEELEEQKVKFELLDEVMPLELREKMDEFHMLRESVKEQIQKEETELVKAKQDRLDFQATSQEVSDWLKNADSQIKSDEEAATFEQVQQQLGIQKAWLEDEESIQQKMDQLLDIAERIAPRLDMNDRTTLRQSVNNLNKRLMNVTGRVGRRHDELEKTTTDWAEYKDKLSQVCSYLDEAESQWESTTDDAPVCLEHARGSLAQAQTQLGSLVLHEELVTQLNGKGRDLDRRAEASTRNAIETTLLTVNERWSNLSTQAHLKHKTLQETVENWEIYDDKRLSVGEVLQAAEACLLVDDIEKVPTEDLKQHLGETKAVCTIIQNSQSDFEIMQKAAQEILARLPGRCDARSAIQKQHIEMQDQYERLRWKTKDQLSTLESEVSQRETFAKEINETIVWLQTAEASLHEPLTVGLSSKQVDVQLQKQETLKQDIALKMAHVERFISQHKENYADHCVEMPADSLAYLVTLRQTESLLMKEIQAREAFLRDAKKIRHNYQTDVPAINRWLSEAELQLMEPPTDPEESYKKHQNLISQLEQYRPKMHAVQAHSEMIADTATDEERQQLQEASTELQQRWLQLQTRLANRTNQLEQGKIHNQQFESTIKEITLWSDKAEKTHNIDPTWTDGSSVDSHIENLKVLAADSPVYESKLVELNQTVDKLNELGFDTSRIERIKENAVSRYATASDHVTMKLAQTESTALEWQEYRQQVAALSLWVEHVREKVDTQSTTRPLSEQLPLQEKILKDIELHEKQVQNIFSQHEKLLSRTGNIVPTLELQLAGEVRRLRHQAARRRDQLKSAVDKQEKYENEISELSGMIRSAREKMDAAPSPSASPDSLRRQILEHEALSVKIASWQTRIDEVNILSIQMAEEVKTLPVSTLDSIDLQDTASSSIPAPTEAGLAREGDSCIIREDSGIVTSPDGDQVPSVPGVTHGSQIEKLSDQKEIGPDKLKDKDVVEGEEIQPTRPDGEYVADETSEEQDDNLVSDVMPRSGTPSSLHSDDTDSLVGEYARHLIEMCEHEEDSDESEGLDDDDDREEDGDSSLTRQRTRSDVIEQTALSTITSGIITDETEVSTLTLQPEEITSQVERPSSIGDSGQVIHGSEDVAGVSPESGIGDIVTPLSLKLAMVEDEDNQDSVMTGLPVAKADDGVYIGPDSKTAQVLEPVVKGGEDYIGPKSEIPELLEPVVKGEEPSIGPSRVFESVAKGDDAYIGPEGETPDVLESSMKGDEAYVGPEKGDESYIGSDIKMSQVLHSIVKDDEVYTGPDSGTPRVLQSIELSASSESLGNEFVLVPGFPHTPYADMVPSCFSITSASSIKELNEAWPALQLQLKERAQDLTSALEQQSAYQGTVHDINRKLGDAQSLLVRLEPPVPAKPQDLRQSSKYYENLIIDLQLLEADLKIAKEKGQAIIDVAGESEGKDTIKTTLKVLSDRLTAVQIQANEKYKLLETRLHERQKHDKDSQRYMAELQAFEAWFKEAQSRHTEEPMSGYPTSDLRLHLRNNKDIQEDISCRQQHLSDLTVECERLSELESPAQAETLRQRLAELERSIAQFKLDAINRQEQIELALKQSERRKRGEQEFRASVDNIQKWLRQTQRLAEAPSHVDPVTAEGRDVRPRTESLGSELREHRQLLESVMGATDPGLESGFVGSEATSESLHTNWMILSRQLAAWKQKLEDILDATQHEEHGRRSLSHVSPQYRRSSSVTTSESIAEMKRSLGELGRCWDKMQGQMDDKQTRLEQNLQFQQLYQDAIQNVSAWLDQVQLRLFGTSYDSDTSQELQEHAALQEELNSLQAEIANMNRTSQQVMEEAGAETKMYIQKLVTDLNVRLSNLEDETRLRHKQLQDSDALLQQFQAQESSLKVNLNATQQKYLNRTAGSVSLDEQFTDQNTLEKEIQDLESQLTDLQKFGERIQSRDSSCDVQSNLSLLNSHWLKLQQRATERRASLERAKAMQTQYEHMLEQYAEYLETAQNKLKMEAISATDLPQLQRQLKAHKEFFHELESHQTLLDTLAAKVDPATCKRYQLFHSRLNNLTHLIQDQAFDQGQKLERLTHQWQQFDEEFKDISSWLQRLITQKPAKSDESDTLDEFRRKIWEYSTMQSALNERKGVMYQVLDRGRLLEPNVCSSCIKNDLKDFTEHWIQISTETTTEMKKLETLVDQWEKFERDAALLETWLESAREKLLLLCKLDESDAQNISAIKQKMDLFLEFRKEVENQLPLKTKVTVLGNQLLQGSPNDIQLQSRLQRIEDQWLHVISELPSNEEQLHSAQIELLPSRQALSELLAWLEQISNILQSDEQQQLTSLIEVQSMLQKYKSLKIDISNRQLTVDFVNQSALHTSSQETVRGAQEAVKTEFAEKLGEMNQKYQTIQSNVSERLKNLELLQLRWQEHERELAALVTWFTEQETRLQKFQKIGHEVTVRQALKECKTLEGQLKKKQKEIDHVTKLRSNLIKPNLKSGSGSPIHDDTAKTLDKRRNSILQEINNLQRNLEAVLGKWSTYQDAVQKANTVLTKTEYSLGRYRVGSGDLVTFQSQIDELGSLQSEFYNSTGCLDNMAESADQLIQICEPLVIDYLQKTVDTIKNRWDILSDQFESRVASLDELYSLWQEYEEKCQAAESWVVTKESDVNAALLQDDVIDNRPLHLEHCRLLQKEIEEYTDVIHVINRLGDKLLPNVDSATIIQMASRETTLTQRLSNMQTALRKHVHQMQLGLGHQQNFDLVFSSVDIFLAEADSVLSIQDPGKSADESVIRERLLRLQELCNQFGSKQLDLDKMNQMGYRLRLSEHSAAKLKYVNERWQQLFADATSRYKSLQRNMLLQQDFSQKCEEWMKFLVQVERDLGAEIAGNYEALLEQQQSFEMFQNEMVTRQQILHSIISQGHQMISEVELENRSDFDGKLERLNDQWQNLILRANKKKSLIDNQVAQWQIYNSESEHLIEKFGHLEERLTVFDFTSATLHKIKMLCNTSKTMQKDLSVGDSLYHKTFESAQLLMLHADAVTKETLSQDMTAIQRRWLDILSTLEQNQIRVDNLLEEWRLTETNLEEILVWLKAIRAELITDIPESYDALQRERQRCQEIEVSFGNAEDKRTQLCSRQQVLATSISPEDMTVLQQRLVLLNKQWRELRHQVALRHQLITSRLNSWTSFSDKYRELLGRLDQMETKITSNRDYHIEDLLHKLQYEYNDQITELDSEIKAVNKRGKQLMQASSDVRANDIEYKLSKLEDHKRRLHNIASARLTKLKETFVVVQQLENNLSQLRQWLAYVEHSLSSPITYQHCNFQQIQRTLDQQQNLQKEVDKRSTGVASVINLCEVLLHDTDACPTSTEVNAIEQAKMSLDKRWRNICTMCRDRKLSIEETWRLWEKFREDAIRFDEWLKKAEKEVNQPRTEATIAVLRDELKRYQVFQREILDSWSQLKQLNKQYRRLAREGRTDTAQQLKTDIVDANRRWDELYRRTATIMRRIKHMVNVTDDFQATREAVVIWLTNIEVRLATLHARSLQDNQPQLNNDLKTIEDEVKQNYHRVEYIRKTSSYLLQKCHPVDTVQIQSEMDDFNALHDRVMTELKIDCPKESREEHAELTGDNVSLQDDSVDGQADDGGSTIVVRYRGKTSRPSSSRSQARSSRGHSPLRTGTPASLASMDWDMGDMYDVEGQLSGSEREEFSNEEEERLYGDERDGKTVRWDDTDGRRHRTRRSINTDVSENEVAVLLDSAKQQLSSIERMLRCTTPVGLEAQRTAPGYSKLVLPCQENIDAIRNVDSRRADRHVHDVLRRWQAVQAQAIQKDYRLQQNKQEYSQFKADMKNVLLWLEEAEAIQATLTSAPIDISQLEVAVRRHKEFFQQLDTRKPMVLSINLTSKELLGQSTTESRDLRDKLASLNQRWDRVCARASVWQKELQIALLQCHELHDMMTNMSGWLDQIELDIKREEPVDFSANSTTLQHKYRKFKSLKEDLERNQQQVLSVCETSEHLLVDTDSLDAVDMRQKLHVVRTRLKSLLTICLTYMTRIEGSINVSQESHPSSFGTRSLTSFSPRTRAAMSRSSRLAGQLLATSSATPYMIGADQDVDNLLGDSSMAFIEKEQPRSGFLSRVFRTALPLQMLMLLLLGVACLVPMTEEDFSCVLANNFRRSLDPVLRYTDGPPPF